MQTKNLNKAKILKYVIPFALYFVLTYLFPYSCDDLGWGTQEGLDLLSNRFEGYNGRYLGNLIVIAITRSNILKAFVMSGCFVGIATAIEGIFRKGYTFYLTFFLVLAVPRLVFRQAMVWTSGFSNYVTSTFLLLVFIAFFFKDLKYDDISEQKKKTTPLLGFGFLLLGFCTTLFIENVTIYSVILGLSALIYTRIHYGKIILEYLLYAVGVVAGAALMFSNSAYHAIATGTDDPIYRRGMLTGGLINRIRENYYSIFYYGYGSYILLLFLFIIVLSILFFKNKQTNFSTAIYLAFLASTSFVLVAYISMGFSHISGKMALLIKLAAFVSIWSLFAFSCYIGYVNKSFKSTFFIACSIAIIIAPLFLITPIGPRTFFPSYIFLGVLLFEVCSYLPEDIIDFMTSKKFALTVSTAVMAIYVFYAAIFFKIYSAEEKRLEYIHSEIAKGETVISVEPLPYSGYVWQANPTKKTRLEQWNMRYKRMYNIPEEIQLIPTWVK